MRKIWNKPVRNTVAATIISRSRYGCVVERRCYSNRIVAGIFWQIDVAIQTRTPQNTKNRLARPEVEKRLKRQAKKEK